MAPPDEEGATTAAELAERLLDCTDDVDLQQVIFAVMQHSGADIEVQERFDAVRAELRELLERAARRAGLT